MERQYTTCKIELERLHNEITAFSNPDDITKLFTEGRHFVEPIFYTAGSAFWFDHLLLAPRLYHLDRQYLCEKGFEIDEFSVLLREMHTAFKTRLRDFIRLQRKNIRKHGLVGSPLSCFIFAFSDLNKIDEATYDSRPNISRTALPPASFPRPLTRTDTGTMNQGLTRRRAEPIDIFACTGLGSTAPAE
jgi:hypothetical protein